MLDFDAWYKYVTRTRFNIGQGTLYSFNNSAENIELLKRTARSNLEIAHNLSSSTSHTTRCFDYFWGSFKDTGEFYFCFPALPVWYNKIVDEFNSYFQNLKVEIIDEYDRIYYVKDYMGENSYRIDMPKELDPHDYKDLTPLKKPIFLLRVNRENYSKDATGISRICYTIHHFFRMLSIPELYYISLLDNDPGENYVEFTLNLANRIIDWKPKISGNYLDMVYRSLTEIKVTLEDFTLLDDKTAIKYIGSEVYGDSRIKQTAIITNLKSKRLKELEGKYFSFDLDKIPNKFFALGTDLIGLGKIDKLENGGRAWVILFNSLGNNMTMTLSISSFLDGVELLNITDNDAKEFIKKNAKPIKKDKNFYTGKKDSWKIYGVTNEYSLLKIVGRLDDGIMVQVEDQIKSPGYRGSTFKISPTYIIPTTLKEWNKKRAYYKTLGI